MLFVLTFPLLLSITVFGVTLAFSMGRALGARIARSHAEGAPPSERDEEKADGAGASQRSVEKGIENLMLYDLEAYKASQK